MTTLSPYAPACGHDQSSAIANRMFGRASGSSPENAGFGSIEAHVLSVRPAESVPAFFKNSRRVTL